MKISIVIPNLNGKKLLEKNLPSLFKAVENKQNNIIEVIVVDDGSWDGSVKFLQKNYKDSIKLVKHTKNRGFSKAVNTGVRATKGDLILLLNTDVIPNVDFLEPVIPHFKNSKVFGVSLHEQGYGWAKAKFANGFIQLAMGQSGSSTHQSMYVSGGSGVFRKKMWQTLGGMDEKLFSPFYWEDIDICYRAWKRGWVCLWEPKARVVHNHESTMSKLSKKYVARIRERNQLLMIWKNIHSVNLFKKHILEVIKRTIKHPGYLIVLMMALAKSNIAIKVRRKEIKESKISDEAIFAKFS